MRRNAEENHLKTLYIQEKAVHDMYKSAKTEREREFYENKLIEIRAEIESMTIRS